MSQSFRPTNKKVFAVEEDPEEDLSGEDEVQAIDFKRSNQNNKRPPSKQYPPNKTQPQNQQPNHNPITSNSQQKPTQIQCFNCKQLGHGFFNCPHPQKEIFCFRCGLANCTLPQCPNCNPGNSETSAKNRTVLHSIETQTNQSDNNQQKQ